MIGREIGFGFWALPTSAFSSGIPFSSVIRLLAEFDRLFLLIRIPKYAIVSRTVIAITAIIPIDGRATIRVLAAGASGARVVVPCGKLGSTIYTAANGRSGRFKILFLS